MKEIKIKPPNNRETALTSHLLSTNEAFITRIGLQLIELLALTGARIGRTGSSLFLLERTSRFFTETGQHDRDDPVDEGMGRLALRT